MTDVEPKLEYTCLASQLENVCDEMERVIKRSEFTLIYCSDKTKAELYDYYVRKLLKCRVHRIRIDI